MEEKYEMVNHPSHYNKYSVEVIDMMKGIYGEGCTLIWDELTAFKYRMRLGEKPDNPIEQDLNKENYYLNDKDTVLKVRGVTREDFSRFLNGVEMLYQTYIKNAECRIVNGKALLND